ncbi:MAG: pyruvate kinase [Gemmatimonadetes bacterium]|nr:MAG: pyruvate kinase [Gemmatimonadota bacterium]
MDQLLTRRRTKIVCTLGPSTDTYEDILALAHAGMDVARFNFSHGTPEDHARRFELVRRVSAEVKRPIAVLQDLQGPKIRVKHFETGEIVLENGADFCLTTRDIIGNVHEVSVTYPKLHQDVEPGAMILLDDGKLRLTVEDVDGQDVHCKVVFGGVLKDNKGVNLPGSVSIEALTPKDKIDLKFGLTLGVDYVALSFVQRPDDIRHIKWMIAEQGYNTPVIAKIEKPQAVKEFEAISDLADGIMIARGDLGVEMFVEEVPPIQKEIIAICNRKGKPVITATQMLESMMTTPRPTRAEAADVANAVLDGTDAVMLSGETAAGKFPVQAVETMDRIITIIEKQSDPRWDLKRRKPDMVYPTPLAIGYSTSHASDLVNAKAIVCLTLSGSMARTISRFRPPKPIIAMTFNEQAYFRTALYWGVLGFQVPEFKSNIDDAVDDIVERLKAEQIISHGDRLVLTAGLPFGDKKGTNILRIEEI